MPCFLLISEPKNVWRSFMCRLQDVQAEQKNRGEVVLQTHYPDHPLLTTLLEKGYQAFAEETLKLRHNMGLPPFSFQALFKAQCRHSEEAEMHCRNWPLSSMNKKLKVCKCWVQFLLRSAKKQGSIVGSYYYNMPLGNNYRQH